MDISKQLSALSKASPTFLEKVEAPLIASDVKVFQINIGKWCNQACQHCHVDASPIRTEDMDEATALQCLKLIESWDTIETVDLTGGAPEGHAQFKTLVRGARALGKNVIDRCNLTILTEPGYEWLGPFLKENQVEVVSSLPHFAARRTDKQRGNGVFERSIQGLQILNDLGYGVDPELPLHLVYNPSGILLSGNQSELQKEFKTKRFEQFNVKFNDLYCINNLPVNRFLESLLRADKYEAYIETLMNAYNPATVEGLMCRHQVNVSHDGKIYDCDFNQMLDLPIVGSPTVFDVDISKVQGRSILTMDHCYGCTAGAGSSCGGELV